MMEDVKIGIAGCGGLGSNVAVHLVRSGLIHFKIVDFDVIDRSNLNRQFYFSDQIGLPKTDALEVNLKRINPAVQIEKEMKRLTPENVKDTYSDCGVIVEGFDKADCKAMIIEAFLNSDKMIVSGSGLAGLNTDNIKVRRFGMNAYIAGDMETDVADKKLYSPKIVIVASLMANLILKKIGFQDEKN